MQKLTERTFVCAFIVAAIVLGGYGFTESNKDPAIRLQGMLSMMGINSCNPSIVRNCSQIPDNNTLLAQLMQLAYTAIPCMSTFMNTTNLESELAEARQTTLYRPLVHRYCERARKMKECMMSAVERSSNCVCDIELEAMMMSPHMVDTLHDFVCASGGERTIKFFDDGGWQFWMEDHKDDLKECGGFESYSNVIQDAKSGLRGVLAKRYNGTKTIRECLIGIGEGNTNTMDFVKDYFNLHLDLMRCVNGTTPDNLALCKDLKSNSIQ